MCVFLVTPCSSSYERSPFHQDLSSLWFHNIILLVPFGFGLPFITNFRFKKVVLAGVLFSIAIEFLQFITGSITGITFRVADINDVIFNTAGVLLGYLLFICFVRVGRYLLRSWKLPVTPLMQYLFERPQI